MTLWIGLSLVVETLVSRPARADHQHDGMESSGSPSSSFGAGLSVVAASFDTAFYGGDYQGVDPSLRWSGGRFAVVAAMPFYRLQENGRSLVGAGDAMVHGQVAIVVTDTTQVGVSLAVLVPSGSHQDGLGMGHVMAMPSAWGSHSIGRFRIGGSAGYSRALTRLENHDHGMWPLVDPMNLAEVTVSASSDVALARALRVGLRVSGALPTEAPGDQRVVGAVRAIWTEGRVETAFEMQAGLAGDPFTLRGVVETALVF